MEKSAPASETVCEVLRGLFRSSGAVSIGWNPYFFVGIGFLSKIPFAWYLYPQIWLSGAKVTSFQAVCGLGKDLRVNSKKRSYIVFPGNFRNFLRIHPFLSNPTAL